MKYLLIVVLVLCAATGWLYRESTRSVADEGIAYGIMSFLCGCAAAVAAVVYILIAFYRHQWL